MRIVQEFKEFAMRGSVVDLALGVVIGGAFGKIVDSLVKDIIMPPIGWVSGGIDLSNMYVNLSGGNYESLEAARMAGATIIGYGAFINTIITFVIVAAAMFAVIKMMNRMHRSKGKPDAPTTKSCPFCFSTIPAKASRCPNCTSPIDF